MRDTILTAAMLLAEKPGGLQKLTRDGTAKRAGVAAGLVTYYFTNMPKLKAAVVRKAAEDENLSILGQAIALGFTALKSSSATATRPYIAGELRSKAIRAAFA